jgi:hypothetical protein
MSMKRVLIAAVAFAAMAGAAAAQPAWDASQGNAPSDYPPCTHPGQDRCMTGHMHGHHKGHAGKGAEKGGEKGGKSSTDGERG